MVWYLWWLFHSGGGGCGMSLCKGGSFNSCSRAIFKCHIHGEVGDKSGDEGGGSGHDDGGAVSGGEGGGQERNHNNQL